MESQSRTELATVLGDLAIQMQSDVDSASLLRTIVAAAIDILPGISWGGIALVHRRTVTSEAPSDAIAKELDAFQSETGEGPAVTALRDHESVVVRDLEVEDRFPRFTERARELGVRSLVSFRLFVEGETFGALTLYGPNPDLFTEESVAVGEIFAQHAAVAIASAAAEEQLQRAVASRDLIGQAKGILMHRDKLTGLQAFAVLVKASQDTNVKLPEVARVLVSDFEATLPQPS